MKMKTLTTFLAVLALALGLAGQASAQAPQVRRPQPTPKKQQTAGSVKITETPAEEAPSSQSTTAQAAPAAPSAAAPAMAPAAQSNQPRDEMAVTSARDWLALVDAGQFGDSYDQAGELYRSAPRDQWANGLGNMRKPLGDVSQRNLKSVLVTKDLPNAPVGKYVISTFDTAFQQQPKPMWEVVTSFLYPNGWKVVGYQVKPQDAAAAPGAPAQKPPQK
jgi:hypothetical protein